ncbi:hypothetical protein TEA_004472 [Camellia sinensis var. sinensis]|uniref:Uncharacterized protein n=2 Tax=Camellia sinensis TaxID=4442 RepID=A0A4S4CZS2_CAMSN|nr:hypothetical protein TEA_004472 [Camellia sinensis var. sinensis]
MRKYPLPETLCSDSGHPYLCRVLGPICLSSPPPEEVPLVPLAQVEVENKKQEINIEQCGKLVQNSITMPQTTCHDMDIPYWQQAHPQLNVQVQSLEIEIEDDRYVGMPFVLVSGGKWIKNDGLDFYVKFDTGYKQAQKDASDGQGTPKTLLDKIANMESEAQKSFMHRSIWFIVIEVVSVSNNHLHQSEELKSTRHYLEGSWVASDLRDSSVSGCRESSSYGDRSASEDLPHEALGHQRGSGQVQVLVLDEIRVDVASQRASKGRIAGKKTEDANRYLTVSSWIHIPRLLESDSSWDFLEIALLVCLCAVHNHGFEMLFSFSAIVQHAPCLPFGFSILKAGLNKSVLLSVYASSTIRDSHTDGSYGMTLFEVSRTILE